MLRVIVAFVREPHEHRRFRDQGLRAVNARVDVTVRQTLFSLAVNMTTATGTAAVLWLGARRVLQERLTIGDLLVILSYIAAVYKPLEAIANTLGRLQDNFVSLRVAFDVLDTKPEIKEIAHPKLLDVCSGAVVFENVSFHYQGRVDTLRNISFRAKTGQRVAIVGPTGAGKTTLISLLPRFYDPIAGRILLDGVDNRQLTLKSLRQQISLVCKSRCSFRAQSPKTFVTDASKQRTTRSSKQPAPRMRMNSSCICRDNMKRSWANAARSCRAASASDCVWRELFSKTRRFSSSMSRLPPSIPRPKPSSSRRSIA